jgi:hypothetical protein
VSGPAAAAEGLLFGGGSAVFVTKITYVYKRSKN